MCAGVSGAVLPGCSGPNRGPARFSDGSVVVALGDWNDVDAAVDVGVGKGECAVTGQTDDADGRARTYEVVTVTGESGWVRASADQDAADVMGPEPIELRAQLGLFGDQARERRLLAGVKRRLQQLAGVETAPIRD